MIKRLQTTAFSLLPLLCLLCVLWAILPIADAQTAATSPQQLVFAGLNSLAGHGQFNAVKADASGNLFLLLDDQDGVRLLKTDASASAILAQIHLGAQGDSGVAMALDPAGNVYITGTSTSTALAATQGAAIPVRTDSSTNSFVAKFDSSLNETFLTFTGGSRIAAASIVATADAVFVTGILYGANLPVTPSAIQQAPAFQSTQSGFVERFSASGSTLVYATYLTGANGSTTPTAIAADTSDYAYVAGSTTASGFPTIAALIPAIASTSSGFLTKFTPAGDGILASTFVPGPGLASLAIDSSGQILLASGAVDPAQFPVDTVTVPLIPTTYQTLLRLPLTLGSVISGTMLAPATQSAVAAGPSGIAWVDGPLTTPLLPLGTYASIGSSFAVEVVPVAGSTSYQVTQAARFGGIANANLAYASLPVTLLAAAVGPTGDAFFAGSAQPTASSSLLATETYDLPLLGSPTLALPSSVRQAETSAAVCGGSLCAGSAAYLARLSPTAGAALAFSTDDAPQLVLRNLGSTTAINLALAVSTGGLESNCGASLGAGAECNLLLSGGAAGTVTASFSSGASGSAIASAAAFPAFAATASAVVFSPKEIDFGIVTSASATPSRTITVTNLGTTSQNFISAADVGPRGTSQVSEVSSDCALAGPLQTKLLAPGATCHITLGFTAGSSDGIITSQWSIGTRDILLTAYSQAAALSLSSSVIGFGTQYVGGLRLPRFLYLSNSSQAVQSHAIVNLPSTSPFTVTDSCPTQLPPTSVCQIRIDYQSPTAPSTDSMVLTLDDGLAVTLTGKTLPQPGVSGSTVNPNLSVTPSAINFPTAVVVTSTSLNTQTVAITNSGASPFTLALALSGDFTDVTSCTGSLGGGQTCAVAITFAPSQAGVRNGLLAITAGAGTSPLYVTLSGTGTAIIPASNGTISFGQTPVGQPVTQFLKIAEPFSSLTLAATGPYTVVLIPDTGVGPGNPSPTSYAQALTGTCQDCFLGIRFLPTLAGVASGRLTLSSTQIGSPYTLALTGTGTSPSGLLISPAAQDLGSVPLHSSSGAYAFTVTNLSTATEPLTLISPAITGDFAFDAATGPPCTGTLAYGASCLVAVAFHPTATGTRTGSLTIGSSGGSAVATLTGFAPPDSGFSLNPTGLTFANVPGSAATVQTITATNTGSSPLQIGNLTTTTSSFLAASACASLMPGTSCVISVTFTPASALITDVLSIPVISGSTAQTYTVALASSYTASSLGLAITPGQAIYGPTPISTQGLTQQFTIANNTANGLTLSTNMPRNFLISGSPCTAVAAGGYCAFNATFLPLLNGDLPGSIVVTGQPSDGSTPLSSIAYGEGYGLGSGALSVQGGLIVNHRFDFGTAASGGSVVHTFTLANLNPAGSGPITVRRVTSQPPFLSTTTCGTALAVSQSCTVTVTYAPSNQVATGTTSPPSIADTGLLSIQSDAASSPDLLNLTGQAVAVTVGNPVNTSPFAAFGLSNNALTFSATTVGDVSAPQTIILSNTGSVALHVSGVSAPSGFGVQSTCTSVIPGGNCTIAVTSAPQPGSAAFGALAISSDSSTSLEYVSLIAQVNPSPLIFTPARLDFGSLQVGATAILPIQIANSSANPIQITALTTTGDYHVAGSCSAIAAAGSTLAANATCIAQVSFTPAAIGQRLGTLALASSVSSSPIMVALTGIGLQSHLTATPTTLAFGPIVVGKSANLGLLLTNSGTADVTGLALTASGDYAVTIPCASATLAAGSSCTVQVTFTPTVTGSRPGTLAITSTDPGSPSWSRSQVAVSNPVPSP
jgi:hypothetical protein